jgi:hypothetical protein
LPLSSNQHALLELKRRPKRLEPREISPSEEAQKKDINQISPHIRISGGNNRQKAHITHSKVKFCKAIIYQHEASKRWAFWRTTTRQAFSKHHSCERNSWLDCMVYLFELRNEWEMGKSV